jgi:hypothetical protein
MKQVSDQIDHSIKASSGGSVMPLRLHSFRNLQMLSGHSSGVSFTMVRLAE